MAGQSLAWRVWRHPATQLVMAVVTVIATVMLIGTIARQLPSPRNMGGLAEVGMGAMVVAIFIAMYVLFCRLVEGRPAHEFALRGAAVELLAGLATGIGLFSAVVGAIALLGGYTIVGYHGTEVLPRVVALALISGFPEEIVFRGLLFRLLEKWLGSWPALAISSALFGLGHIFNPNSSWLAAIAITLEAGIMLGAIYMITRRLWAAIGVHAAWNFAQGGIYGIAISGGKTDGLLIPGPNNGISTLITGGSFGAEASLPAIAVATAFGIALLVIAVRRDKLVSPLWARNRQGAGVHE